MKRAYGGVVIDLDGRVLLREPMDHHRGVAWTFAKGKPKGGEAPQETALREVLEETGVQAKILVEVPEESEEARARYFLMLPLDVLNAYDEETLTVKWVTQEQAVQLISQTSKPNRRARDLRVLEAAFGLYRSIFGPEQCAGAEAQMELGAA